MDSFDNSNDENFLRSCIISDSDYDHKIESTVNYHDLDLKNDVLLLADVFENFQKTWLEYYGLDPCHYSSSQGPAWDEMLKMTNVKLDLLSDIDMYQLIERGMKGVISYIYKQHISANNKCMKNYDPKKESSYIMYLGANGWCVWMGNVSTVTKKWF